VSIRRKAGDIVYKRPGAGFVGVGSWIKLEAEDEATYGISYCCLDCGDEDCREWANCQHCDSVGEPLPGYAYHVSECEMQDRDMFLCLRADDPAAVLPGSVEHCARCDSTIWVADVSRQKFDLAKCETICINCLTPAEVKHIASGKAEMQA
jgi:hypothetical protein